MMMVVWVLLISDSPETDRKISSAERMYILTSLKPEQSAHSKKVCRFVFDYNQTGVCTSFHVICISPASIN